ncbi:NTP_transf_2 domain-containing protein, partial [Haematococcus lacustris]
FGSVPLKTYLPDGDIDLSIFCPHIDSTTIKDNWAQRLHAKLEEEQRSPRAPFKICDVQVIHAEVKLLKLLVDNIVVDISYSQLGGLCALTFLEAIDLLAVPNHVFKRSIILVKAWCYYESRLLGAHHGLLSTYGLEALVLYIFNLYHRRISSPL